MTLSEALRLMPRERLAYEISLGEAQGSTYDYDTRQWEEPEKT